MKDNEIAELINALRDVAVRYHDAQQLRERISFLILPICKKLQRIEKENLHYSWQDNLDRMGR